MPLAIADSTRDPATEASAVAGLRAVASGAARVATVDLGAGGVAGISASVAAAVDVRRYTPYAA
ncbi:MAG: hypothetical protein D4S02_04325, partial [Rhodocyclaceae bacterium]